MIKSIKVQLCPNDKQSTLLHQSAGVARWAYNWTLAKQKEYYNQTKTFTPDGILRKELTQLKQTDEYKWLYDYSNNITKKAVIDACDAYIKFFNKKSKYPRFKSKKKTRPSFFQDGYKIKFNSTHVRLEKIGRVKLAEFNRIPFGNGEKYLNPRITFDGINWWISIGIECEDIKVNKCKTEPVGLDLGVKDFLVTSNNDVYKNINNTKEMKRLDKKLKRLQRKLDSKYSQNKKGSKYIKTSNILKLENQIRYIYRKIAYIRNNYIHQITTSLVKTNPEYIVIENLDINSMKKNKSLYKYIIHQNFYEFRRQLEYKCKWYAVPLIIADKWYPSSKTCSCCGYVKKDLKLSNREFKCPTCGITIDRDLNASLNLKNYGKLTINI